MTSNTPPPAGNHASPATILPDPATENEGFRAYKAGLAAGRAEGAAAARDLNWQAAQALSDWLDGEVSPGYKQEPLAQDWARIAKVAEETGEAIEAFIGVTGQNPRKGLTHSMDDVLSELADVALTGIYAMVHFCGADRAREVLNARQRRHHERIGLPFADLLREDTS